MEYIDAGLEHAPAQSEGTVVAMAGYGTAVLNNGLGRYEAAVDGAQHSSDEGDYGYAGASLPELVEAASRSGRPEVAAAALRRLEERTRAAGTDWALGVLARSQALLSEGDDADALYREAIERLERTRIRVELARARLLYGEWLRREGRRVDAREQLRAAHDTFAAPAPRRSPSAPAASSAATGETVPRRTAQTRDVLTPQEAQIARLAADGQTNPEIGAQLFISPRTVEYHLRKVFTKLGISSRRELPRGARDWAPRPRRLGITRGTCPDEIGAAVGGDSPHARPCRRTATRGVPDRGAERNSSSIATRARAPPSPYVLRTTGFLRPGARRAGDRVVHGRARGADRRRPALLPRRSSARPRGCTRSPVTASACACSSSAARTIRTTAPPSSAPTCASTGR